MAIEQEFDGPVTVEGVSTRGSVALQSASDHPHLVARLIVLAAARGLSDHGGAVPPELARSVETGMPRRGWASMGMRWPSRSCPDESPPL